MGRDRTREEPVDFRSQSSCAAKIAMKERFSGLELLLRLAAPSDGVALYVWLQSDQARSLSLASESIKFGEA